MLGMHTYKYYKHTKHRFGAWLYIGYALLQETQSMVRHTWFYIR